MRKIAMLLFITAVTGGPGLAQSSNTAAGLAGVGAGAALGAASTPAGTTPSSVGSGPGGGSAPIEIQIMAFDGLRKIAFEIAAITRAHRNGCVPSIGPNADYDNMDQESANACAVLIEDPTSSNQIALYQAVQAYYDHLHLVVGNLQSYFPLEVVGPTVNFSLAHPSQAVMVTNVSTEALTIGRITVTGANADNFMSDESCPVLQPSESCTIHVTFSVSKPLTGNPTTLTAELHIPLERNRTQQVIELKANAPTQDEVTKKAEAQKAIEDFNKNLRVLNDKLKSNKKLSARDIQNFTDAATEISEIQTESVSAPESAPSASPPPSSGGGAASSNPVDLTYLSGIMTALGGIKSGITYAPSSFQPTTQAFEVLVETELSKLNIISYTSTSALNFLDAKNALAGEFGQMLDWGTKVSNWTTLCKPPTGNTTTVDNAKPSPPKNTACTNPQVLTDLAVAQQMITGYTSLLTAANDGSGSTVIVDVLRGKVLSDKMKKGIPSLQVTVAAAGGSTKTNSYFGVSLFYQFAPSYNAGVIATFELRDPNDVLLESGARNVLFAYRKWKSGRFETDDIKHANGCGFCSSR